MTDDEAHRHGRLVAALFHMCLVESDLSIVTSSLLHTYAIACRSGRLSVPAAIEMVEAYLRQLAGEGPGEGPSEEEASRPKGSQ